MSLNTNLNYHDTIQNFVLKNYPTPLAMVVAGIPAVAAIECAVHLLANSGGNYSPTSEYNFSANLGGALFYGMCAAHVIPGSHYIGAAIFGVWSMIKCDQDDAYLTSKVIGTILRSPFNGLVEIFKRAQHPIWLGVIPLSIAAVAYKTFYS